MALIGKIREKSWLLVIIVGIALIAFILPQFTKNNILENNPGIVDGKKVNPELYAIRSREVLGMDEQQAMQSGRPYTEQDQENSYDKAWNSIVEDMIYEKEFDALGIDASEKEIDAYLYGTDGFTVMENLRNTFVDGQGNFDGKALEKRIQDMESSKDPEEKANWERTKVDLKKQRKIEKYFQLLSQAAYVTNLEAEEEYLAQQETKSISFAGKRFSDIDDSEIKVTDEMVEKYYNENKNKKKWESMDSREVKYFEVKIAPSKEDTDRFNKEISRLKDQFERAKNDSLFVLANSDLKAYSSKHEATFMPEGTPKARQGMTYPSYMDTIFKTASIGQVVGPYDDKGATRLAKVIGVNKYSLKARHILIGATQGDSVAFVKAQKTADSIMQHLNKNNFEEFVTKFSKDEGSIAKGGVYEDFMDFEMVPEFSDFIVENPVGKIGSVKTIYGIHIIEVLDKKTVNYPVLAIVQKTLEASDETIENAQNEAYDVLERIATKVGGKKKGSEKVALFDTIAKKSNFFVTQPIAIYRENPRVYALETPLAKDKIIKLAYEKEAKVGDLVSSPIKDGNKYIIAIVSAIHKKGTPELDEVFDRMKAEVTKEQKALRLTKQVLNVKQVEDAAKAFNTSVQEAEVIFANPQLQGSGVEPKVIGSIYAGLKDGQTTVPLIGDNGVYIVRLNKTKKAPAVSNYLAQKQQMLMSAKNNMPNGIRQAMYKAADIKDNRKFNMLGLSVD